MREKGREKKQGEMEKEGKTHAHSTVITVSRRERGVWDEPDELGDLGVGERVPLGLLRGLVEHETADLDLLGVALAITRIERTSISCRLMSSL